MDYLNTNSNAILRFHASDMVLHINSDAAYLVLPKARSQITGYFQLANHPTKPPMHNGPILVECKGLRHVVCSLHFRSGNWSHVKQPQDKDFLIPAIIVADVVPPRQSCQLAHVGSYLSWGYVGVRQV